MSKELGEKDINKVVGGKIIGDNSEKINEGQCKPTTQRVLTNQNGRYLQGEKYVCSDPLKKGAKSQCATCPARNN